MPLIYMRLVRSRGLRPDWKYMEREVSAELDNRIKPDLLGYFNRIVANWSDEHRPAFRARKSMTKQAISVWVYPTGPGAEIWKLVSITGAKPHEITPKHKSALKFVWGGPGSYKARTTTAGGYKGPGAPSGEVVFRGRVFHPGFKSRNFEKHIARWYKPKFRRNIENAFRRGISKAKAHGTR